MTKKIGKKYWVLLPDNNKIGNFGPIDYFSSMYNANVFPVEYSNPVNEFLCLPDKREGIKKKFVICHILFFGMSRDQTTRKKMQVEFSRDLERGLSRKKYFFLRTSISFF